MASRSPKRKHHILVVDDEPQARAFLSDLLSAWQFSVIPAASGWDALEILQQRTVDLVLLDLVMPTMDGAETLHAIRLVAPRVPVLMMGALMTPELRQYLCDRGAQGFLAKPVRRSELALALFPWVYTGESE
jgi:CheY-like chemotaxis protein